MESAPTHATIRFGIAGVAEKAGLFMLVESTPSVPAPAMARNSPSPRFLGGIDRESKRRPLQNERPPDAGSVATPYANHRSAPPLATSIASLQPMAHASTAASRAAVMSVENGRAAR
jgi:hypothetical protein